MRTLLDLSDYLTDLEKDKSLSMEEKLKECFDALEQTDNPNIQLQGRIGRKLYFALEEWRTEELKREKQVSTYDFTVALATTLANIASDAIIRTSYNDSKVFSTLMVLFCETFCNTIESNFSTGFNKIVKKKGQSDEI